MVKATPKQSATIKMQSPLELARYSAQKTEAKNLGMLPYSRFSVRHRVIKLCSLLFTFAVVKFWIFPEPTRTLTLQTDTKTVVMTTKIESTATFNWWEDSTFPDLARLASRMKGDDWKKPLFQRLAHIRDHCGSLCQNSASHEAWMQNSVSILGANIRLTIATDVDCQYLLGNKEIDAADSTVPYPIPDDVIPYYTADGAIDVTYLARYQDVYLGGNAKENLWTEKMVQDMVNEHTRRNWTVAGSYGYEATEYVKGKLSELQIRGKHCLVVGSERPWIEAILLALGAAHVTTLEYGTIESQHPQIDTMTPEQMRQRYLNGTLGLFDVIVTHSSVEHSGLGRYGDALNPWGDLLALARAWCVSKPEAQLYLGVPIGRDVIEFNGHRVYGKLRMSLLATNWVQIDGDKHKDEDFESGVSLSFGGSGMLFKKVEKFDAYVAHNVVQRR